MQDFIRRYPAVAAIAIVAVLGIALTVGGQGEAARMLVSGASLVIAAMQLKGMIDDLRSGTYGIDIIAVTAIVSAVAVGEHWAALVVCLMLTGGEGLEDYAEVRASSELTALLEGAPTVAYREGKDGEPVEVDIADIAPGDRLIVRPHEIVPVDARLVSDMGIFDESSLTGESMPVEHRAGEQVLSGALNGTEAVLIESTSHASDSQYQRIIALVEEARDSQAPFVRLADRVAVPFTIFAFALAGLAWLLSGDATRFAQVLVVATPCPLIIAAPVAFMAGMSRGARGGMIVKSAGTIEKISRINRVAFDKTGTLTRGIPEVVDIHPKRGIDREELLAIAGATERFSSHPLATAIVDAAAKVGMPEAKRVEEVPAHGVTALIDGAEIRVGKASWANGESVADIEPGHTLVWVSRNNESLGSIELADTLRPEAATALAVLANAGTQTMMVTGDREETATGIARELGIATVAADLLPEDKVRAIEGEETLMVGDGVNDAPVLAAADVGVAMGARGSAAAVESADVVIMLDDLTRVTRLMMLGRGTMKIAWQAIGIGVGLSIILMFFGAFGAMSAFAGAWMQELVDVACIVWALRAARPSSEERNLDAMLAEHKHPAAHSEEKEERILAA
ncbi:MAG: heavy metal translocating P-type ATPase [Flaviflexus sp.]|nr:heavy metal translocating P-type ATPase [Flaviflexus sp.]